MDPEPGQYVWSYWMGDIVHGGMKARRDCEEILRRSGRWGVFDTGTMKSKPARLARIVASLVWLARQPRSTIFLVQYPMHGGRVQKLIGRLLFHRFRVAVLLHDLYDLWEGKTPNHPLLSRAACVVSVGRLQDFLGATLEDIPVSHLEPWDYLTASDFEPGRWDPAGPILFAGSLWPMKVSWLYRPDAHRPPLLLRGHGYDEAQNPQLGDTLAGPFTPENPAFDPSVGWGLVWDGAKLDSQISEKDYERLNQPHKVSLYLACGLPLIVWSESYAAPWVLRHGCGIAVPSLAAIPEALAKVTPEEHRAMQDRSRECGEQVRRGDGLIDVLAKLGL